MIKCTCFWKANPFGVGWVIDIRDPFCPAEGMHEGKKAITSDR